MDDFTLSNDPDKTKGEKMPRVFHVTLPCKPCRTWTTFPTNHGTARTRQCLDIRLVGKETLYIRTVILKFAILNSQVVYGEVLLLDCIVSLNNVSDVTFYDV